MGRRPLRRMELPRKAPGPKKMAKGTMAKGWQRFARTLAGFLIAKSDAVG